MVVSEGPSVAHDLAADSAAVVVPFEESFADTVQDVLRDDEWRTDMSLTVEQVAETMSWQNRVQSLTGVYQRE